MRSFSLFFILVVSFNMHSQDLQNKSSEMNGMIRYTTDTIVSENIPKKHTVLYFDRDSSLYFSEKIGLSPKQPGSAVSEQNKGASMALSHFDKKGNQVFRNFKTKEIHARTAQLGAVPPYTYKDQWIPINWKIFDEHKEIMGYSAQKAKGYFRGRKYTVYFSEEIPLPVGPWKLFGLPGVILYYKANFQHYGFVATKVCYPCDSIRQTIKKPEEELKLNLKEHVYFQDYKIETLVYYMGKESDNISLRKNQKTPLSRIQRHRKLSKELIYNWEEFPGDTEKPKSLEWLKPKISNFEDDKNEKNNEWRNTEFKN